MRLLKAARFVPFVLAASALVPAARAGVQLPLGFVVDKIGANWNAPVGMCFIDSTRMLVAEKGGTIWYLEHEQKKNLCVDLTLEVLNIADRGLLSIAIDPQFDANGYVYLMYAVDPNQDGADGEKESFCKLTRFTFLYDAAGNLLADPTSRWEMLGDSWGTGIPACYYSHTVGTIRFMSDGSLVLTCGDAAHYDANDTGGLDGNCFGAGKFSADQDVGSYRSVYPNTLAGKVLRLDPATGLGLPDNPWFDGDPGSFVSRTWASGLRNPFRFNLLPGSGPRETMFIGDVGWNTWEEVNVCRGGENFGWPCIEGNEVGIYTQIDPHGLCAGVLADNAPPILAYHHFQNGQLGFKGNCVSGVAWYSGTSYPPLFRNTLFVCDYGQNWLKVLRLDQNQQLIGVIPFGTAMDRPIDLQIDPATGDLVYISFVGGGEIRRIKYLGINQPPVATVSTGPTWGTAPLAVTFDASASTDPEGGPLVFAWDFGDGATSNQPTATHVYTASTNATATLTVTDDQGYTSTESFLVSPGNTPPHIVQVNAPADGFLFTEGQPFEVSAVATDDEDGQQHIPVQVQWIADLVHEDHQHPGFATVDGPSGQMTLESHGPGTFYLLRLVATDSRGLAQQQTLALYDSAAQPEPVIDGLSDATPRLGQALTATGHVEYPNTNIGWAHPDLIWDWGDGTSDTFLLVAHQQPTAPTHVYAQTGDYTLRLTVRLGDFTDSVTAPIKVEIPKPAVALFTPLLGNGYIPWDEQETIAQTIQDAMAAQGTEAAVFAFNQQQELVDWMTPYLDDGVRDILVVLDFAPARAYAGQDEFSLAEEWLEHGNAIVWSGAEAFNTYILENGLTSATGAGGHGPDEILDAPYNSYVCRGAGTELLTPLAGKQLPSLQPYIADWALRYTRLPTNKWKVAKLYAHDDLEPDSDAILMRHVGGGFYAQLLSTATPLAPRDQVLVEFLQTYDRYWAAGAPPIKKP